MIIRYVEAALRRAKYDLIDRGEVCATVPGLPGVIASAGSVEACREQLAEVIEEWLLVRVARGQRIPPLGRERIVVRKAS